MYLKATLQPPIYVRLRNAQFLHCSPDKLFLSLTFSRVSFEFRFPRLFQLIFLSFRIGQLTSRGQTYPRRRPSPASVFRALAESSSETSVRRLWGAPITSRVVACRTSSVSQRRSIQRDVPLCGRVLLNHSIRPVRLFILASNRLWWSWELIWVCAAEAVLRRVRYALRMRGRKSTAMGYPLPHEETIYSALLLHIASVYL